MFELQRKKFAYIVKESLTKQKCQAAYFVALLANAAIKLINLNKMDEFDEIIISLEACASKMPAGKKPKFFMELGRLRERIHQRELFYTRMIKNDPRVKPN